MSFLYHQVAFFLNIRDLLIIFYVSEDGKQQTLTGQKQNHESLQMNDLKSRNN